MGSFFFVGGAGTVNGQVLGSAGTAAAPTYTVGEVNTGIYQSANHTVDVSTNGTLAATFDASQNLKLAAALKMSATAPAWNATAPTSFLGVFQNNGVTVASLDLGGNLIPAAIDPSTYYFCYDWDDNAGTANFSQNGNVVVAAVNSVSAPLMGASNMGAAYVNTSSTTAGGYLSLPASYPLVASAVLNYQWRVLFYMPAASTSANRYTAFIGGMTMIGTANNANAGPFAGPYISYADNVNGGKWVLGSAVNATRTTGNAASATPSFSAWNTLLISLANGTYTYTVNGTQIGTLADAHITSSPANGQAATAGGLMIIPDGTNFTTQATLMIDRSDYLVTGLSR